MTHTFTVKIECGNDAFTDEAGNVTNDSAAPELARILREIADRFREAAQRGLWTPRLNSAHHLLEELTR